MLRVVMAVSDDGYVSTGAFDDMTWTGSDDKTAFKLLTSTGGVLGVSYRTFLSMPSILPGRTTHVLTQRPRTLNGMTVRTMTLGEFAHRFPGAWLIGGQTLVMEALRSDMVSEVHLCRSPVSIYGESASPQPDEISRFLMTRGEDQNLGVPWRRAQSTYVGDCRVDCYRRLA